MIILLAEDDLDDQELLAESFHELDPSVQLRSFTTGRKFLNYIESLAEQDMPDMVIVDYNLPEFDGAEILRQLNQERYQNIIKLVWSTSDSPAYKVRCLSEGARDYLLKPSNVNGLMDLAKKILSFYN